MPDLDRFKNPWAAENSQWYGNAYRKWNRPEKPENLRTETGSKDEIIAGYNYDLIQEKYYKDGQDILEAEYLSGIKDSYNKNRWKDTCAVKLSWALNNAGYQIPEHDLNAGVEGLKPRWTWTSNINSAHQYILGADEMGSYLRKEFGYPTVVSNGAITDNTQLTKFITQLDEYEGYGGLIYFDSINPSSYGASGHVDLVYEKSNLLYGNYPYIYGLNKDLENYLDYRNGDGWFNSNSKLKVWIWLLKGKKK